MYGIDLLEFAHQTKLLDTSVTVPNKYGNAPINQVGNQRILTTPANQDKEIVGPSNSTLYSNAHLDLSKGPIVLHVPAVPHHRYYAGVPRSVSERVPLRGDADHRRRRGQLRRRGPRFQGPHAGRDARRQGQVQPGVAVRAHAGLRQERPAHRPQDPGRLPGDPDEGLRAGWTGLQAGQAPQDRHHAHGPDDPDRGGLLRRSRRRAGQVPAAGHRPQDPGRDGHRGDRPG